MDKTKSVDVVRFLHENRSEGCTVEATTGDLETLLFLCVNRNERCDDACFAVNSAVSRLHQEVVEWFCETFPDRVDLETARSRLVKSFLNQLIVVRDRKAASRASRKKSAKRKHHDLARN
uniref:Uncharacterized protein n=1 Tax=Globisporangium ultimum (strain ATCC 200006 / CBS 805.95 / DAOM BR144) TaxID=431595 RepID=K3WNR1_GLOUD